MSLGDLVVELGGYLGSALTPAPALAGGAYPVKVEELPAVTISVVDASQRGTGIGGFGGTVPPGAHVEATVDLARPAAATPPAALSGDRLTLRVPAGPLVTDGGPDGVVTVAVAGKALAVVTDEPAKGQVQPDPERGELHFGAPLPAKGTLRLSYPVAELRSGSWRGTLAVDVTAADAAGVEGVCGQLGSALGAARGNVPGLRSLGVTSWGPIDRPDGAFAGERRRRISCSFDYEALELPAAEWPLKVVSVVSSTDGDGLERFDVQREGSS
jgi:hypothetical protein